MKKVDGPDIAGTCRCHRPQTGRSTRSNVTAESCTSISNRSDGPSGSSHPKVTTPTTAAECALSRWVRVRNRPITPLSSPSFTKSSWPTEWQDRAACPAASCHSVCSTTTKMITSSSNSTAKWWPTRADAIKSRTVPHPPPCPPND